MLCARAAGLPAESLPLIQTMQHIYSKLTKLTSKSLFPPLGLHSPFQRAEWATQSPSYIYCPLPNKTREGRIGVGGVGREGRRNQQTLTLLPYKEKLRNLHFNPSASAWSLFNGFFSSLWRSSRACVGLAELRAMQRSGSLLWRKACLFFSLHSYLWRAFKMLWNRLFFFPQLQFSSPTPPFSATEVYL